MTASPTGTGPWIRFELFAEDPVCKDFYENHSDVWKNTVKLSDLAGKASDFDAVFSSNVKGPFFTVPASSSAGFCPQP